MPGHNGRIDIPAACGKAMALLEGGAHTCGEVSASTGLDMHTVELIAAAVSKQGAAAEEGWMSLPGAVRLSAIKSVYSPTPPQNAWALARLMAEGATAPESAVRLPVDRGMRELIEAGYVRRIGDRFHLAGIGPSLARGVLSMYPEIGSPAFSRSGGSLPLARRLVHMAAEVAPPRIDAARRKEAGA